MRVRASDPDVVFGVHRRAANAVAWVSVALAFVFGVALAYVLIVDRAAWTPLGPYPEQTVVGTGSFKVGGGMLPAITVEDEAVSVTGKKCFREAVTVSGAVSWASVSPPGLTLQVGDGVRDRKKGCVEATFVNLLPVEVRVWAQALFDKGRPYVVMQITGREQAIDGDRTSEPQIWRTEDFVILPEGTDH